MTGEFEEFGRFVDKVEAMLTPPFESPSWEPQELIWWNVLKYTYRLCRRYGSKEDSYRKSCSAIADILVAGGDRDYESLLTACVIEHRGRYGKKFPESYAGEIDEVAAPPTADEEGVWASDRTRAAVENTLRMLPKPYEVLLRRRYFDSTRPTFKQLARELKTTPAALKMKAKRARDMFKRLHGCTHYAWAFRPAC